MSPPIRVSIAIFCSVVFGLLGGGVLAQDAPDRADPELAPSEEGAGEDADAGSPVGEETAGGEATRDAGDTLPEAGEQDDDAASRIEELELEVEDLREELEVLREDLEFDRERLEQTSVAAARVSGYLDVGFFWAGGDGSGIRADFGHRNFPEYTDVVIESWVFMGDPLSTAINARGEPADTGDSRAVVYDPVDSGGGPSFIANTLSLTLFGGLSEELTANGQVDLVPRGRNVSRGGAGSFDPDELFLGDSIDVRLVYLEWRPALDALDLSLFVGKFDSVLGTEYRTQDAPDRIEVTPSLICRYTCGHPIGIKARASLLEDRNLVLAAAVTNGSHFVENFPFYDEVDMNPGKSVAGRLSYELPLGAGLEVGVSGAIGPQDQQTDDGVLQWHVGADVALDWQNLVLSAEYVRGRARGETEPGQPTCNLAPCLRYQGAYGRLGYRATNWLVPYVRVDWRDALHRFGADFVYVSELIRGTAGVHLELGPHVTLKAEYTLNRELGRIPQFANDVFTSSAVVEF